MPVLRDPEDERPGGAHHGPRRGDVRRAAETEELSALTRQAITALRKAGGAQGFNVGMNLGGVAGAGIAAHLHQHVVPRWGGDTNFMPIVGQTRVLPQLLRDTRELLAEAWPQE